MWTRAELKARAKATLKTTYWKAFLIGIIVLISGGTLNNGNFNFRFDGSELNSLQEILTFKVPLFVLFFSILTFLIFFALLYSFRVFLGYPLEVGARRYYIRAAHGEPDMNHLGSMFKSSNYINVIKSMLWRFFINFLWYLLLIIPGIIKNYAYSMVPHILADNPNIGYKRALELSEKMTDGEKFDLWIMDLSFIGWYILGLLALFVGALFVIPYQLQTNAELYITLRENALRNGLCTHEELFPNF